jgi:hypothetical protein
MVRIGVLLPTAFARGGELLADVSALDAAGAYAVLVEGSDPEAFVVLAAAAAVTRRVKVGCVVGDVFAAGAFAVLNRISGDRALVFARDRGTAPERTDGVIIAGLQPGEHAVQAKQLAPAEVWAEVSAPADRQGWAEMLAAYDEARANGVVVRWDPRLVDLLRNPDADDDRSDLQMSTG